MGIEVGKIAVIFDDDPRLATVWKGKVGETKTLSSPFPFSTGNSQGDNGGDPGSNEGNRPQLADIVLKGFEPYDDSFGVQKVKAKFRIYNSSEEAIDGFLYALTKPDAQGGRA